LKIEGRNAAFFREVTALRAITIVGALTFAAEACSSDDGLAPAGPSGGAAGSALDAGAGRSGGGAAGSGIDAGGPGGASGAGGASGGAAGTGGTSGGSGGTTGGTGGTSDGSAGTGGGADGSSGASGRGGSAGDRADATWVDAVIDAEAGLDAKDGSADAPGDGDITRPPCMKSPSQVVVLGDSYINWISHTFPADLVRESGVTYRMYAVGAAAMATGGLSLIPPQFDQAVAADPNIIAAIMDGGGNDILVADTAQFPQGADCKQLATSPTIPDCQKIVERAVDKAVELMDTAAAKGVKDVVYFFYPHVPEGTLIGGAHPNAILDYALPKVKATCDGAMARTGGRLTCHFLDLIPVFDQHPDYFAFTDIHPNSTGSQAMAKAVWAVMKNACIAQPASSGCCAP
jgi:hypothetical protein